jgi:hypothetical protein
LSKLQNIYVWQSKVTDEGIKKLQAKLPNVKIHKGVELTATAPKEEAK